MELPINRDPQSMNKSIFSFLKWWQMLCLITAITGCVLFTILFDNVLNSTINGMLCGLVVVLPGYIAFYNKKGLDFFEYEKIRHGRSAFLYENEAPPEGMEHKRKEDTEDGQMESIQEV
jgi:hypothetical protein